MLSWRGIACTKIIFRVFLPVSRIYSLLSCCNCFIKWCLVMEKPIFFYLHPCFAFFFYCSSQEKYAIFQNSWELEGGIVIADAFCLLVEVVYWISTINIGLMRIRAHNILSKRSMFWGETVFFLIFADTLSDFCCSYAYAVLWTHNYLDTFDYLNIWWDFYFYSWNNWFFFLICDNYRCSLAE